VLTGAAGTLVSFLATMTLFTTLSAIKSIAACDADQDCYICPAGEHLTHKTVNQKQKRLMYTREGCHTCALKPQCTKANKRWVSRHFNEDAFERCEARLNQNPTLTRQRMAIVERPFAILKQIDNGLSAFSLLGNRGYQIGDESGRIELQLKPNDKSRRRSCTPGRVAIAESLVQKSLSSKT
jgi:hypothetical protein